MEIVMQVEKLHEAMESETDLIAKSQLRGEIYGLISAMVESGVCENPFQPGSVLSLYFSIEVGVRLAA